MKQQIKWIILLAFISIAGYNIKAQSLQSAKITVDLNKEIADMKPVWAWFGYDEPNYTYMKDGKQLLSELAELSTVPVYVRTHSLLVTGDGTPALKWGSTNAYTEDAAGHPIYNWRIIDSIFDTYIQRGMKPLAQIGFMPEALSSKPQPYKHHWQPGQPYNDIFTGWTAPPKDYNKWAALVYEWVKHSVERYGKKEVQSWYWELWNEPDSPYWGGTLEEYLKLYDYTVEAALEALPEIHIGGPHVTGPNGQRGAKFLKAFLEHCANGTNYATGQKGTPLHFVAFHAKGSPKIVDGHVQMNMGQQLRDIRAGFSIVASSPAFKHLPIIIGESDPEGCAACGMATNPSNAYRNGTMYSSYTAASFARKYLLADSLGVNFLGAVSWSFEFENQPWFYGFRDLATNGVDKPVLNVFRMFGMMTGKRVAITGDHIYPVQTVTDSSVRRYSDVSGLAAKNGRSATVMLWNYHDDDIEKGAAEVGLYISGIPARKLKLTHYRIDKEHSNSYELWKGMGSPQNPSEAQIEKLRKGGRLQQVQKPTELFIKNGQGLINVDLPAQGVSLLKLDW